jgi:amino acid permease
MSSYGSLRDFEANGEISALNIEQKEEGKVPSTYKFGYVLPLALIALVCVLGYTTINTTPSSNALMNNEKMESAKSPNAIKAKTHSNPNIVFILADDLGYNSIGYQAFDLDGLSTTLTSMMKDGIYLENFYAQEECTPCKS